MPRGRAGLRTGPPARPPRRVVSSWRQLVPQLRARASPGRRATAVEPGEVGAGERLPGEAPQHGPQLVVLVQAHAVVEPAQPVALAHQVRALAVGVVDHRVEGRDGAHRGRVLVDHHDRVDRRSSSPLQHRQPPGRHRVGRARRRRRTRAARRGRPPTAAPTRPARPVAQHRLAARRPSPPVALIEVGRDLAGRERAVREVPQRALAARSACRSPASRSSSPSRDQEREVGGVGQRPEHHQVCARQEVEGDRRADLRAGLSACSRSRGGRCAPRVRAGHHRTGRAGGRPRPPTGPVGRRPAPATAAARPAPAAAPRPGPRGRRRPRGRPGRGRGTR